MTDQKDPLADEIKGGQSNQPGDTPPTPSAPPAPPANEGDDDDEESDEDDENEGEGGENGTGEVKTPPTPPAPPQSEPGGKNDPTAQAQLPTSPLNTTPKDQLDVLAPELSTASANSDYSKKPESGKIEVRVKTQTYNKKGEHKYSPEEVMSLLALYDDFTNVRGYDKTRYQLEFVKLVEADRVADLENTKKLLKRQGHEV